MQEFQDSKAWAMQQFGECKFHHQKLTDRGVKVAERILSFTSGTTPQQCGQWTELKGAYRFFDHEDVTFEAITQPHYDLTKQAAEQERVLVLCDTTEVSFGNREVEGAGSIGPDLSCGFLLHNALMVRADSGEILGLAAQQWRVRQLKSNPQETKTEKMNRERETCLWLNVISDIGEVPDGAKWIYVCDRGADCFEVFMQCVDHRTDWVIRLAQLERGTADTTGIRWNLAALLANQPVMGTYTTTAREPGKKPRDVQMEVRVCQGKMLRSHCCAPAVKDWCEQHQTAGIDHTVIEVREVVPADKSPQGKSSKAQSKSPLHWVLSTSLPVSNLAEALVVIGYYEQRWKIEELHKAMKTGCQMEERKYRTLKRQLACAGMLSVVSVRLLQLRWHAQQTPDLPALEKVPEEVCRALEIIRGHGKKIVTMKDFVHQLAGLGGFLGRKHDGHPGWLTLWRGWEKFNLIYQTHQLLQKPKSCG